MNTVELGSAFPTVSTASLRKAVESGGCKCKARLNASLMRLAKNPALHMASILVHFMVFDSLLKVLLPRLPDGGRRRR